VLTGSTRLKAGSATKLALNIISTVTFARLGKVYGNLMVDLAATNDKLVDRAIRILRTFDAELTREAALALLERAGRQLKTAIVMLKLNVERDEAERRLREARGQLRAVIG
jgi:N-acetylmuramic acid 6-phosphate etherase